MKTDRCGDVSALVPGYLDGELSEEQAAPLRRHLLSCPDCRAAAQDLTSLRRWFPAPEPAGVPAGFAARVARAAFAGVEPGQRPAPEERVAAQPADRAASEVLPFLLTLTTVAASTLFVLAIMLGSSERPSGEQLVAEPLSEILRELDQLNASADDAPDEGLNGAGLGR